MALLLRTRPALTRRALVGAVSAAPPDPPACCAPHARARAVETEPGSEPQAPPGAALGEAAKAAQLEGLFWFALVWSVGASCDAAGRAKFDRFVRTLAAGGAPEGYAACLGGAPRPALTAPPIPERDAAGAPALVYDWRWDRPGCAWVPWLPARAAPLAAPRGTPLSDIIVPTLDTARCARARASVRALHTARLHAARQSSRLPSDAARAGAPPPAHSYSFLLELTLQHGTPLLLVGASGSGKTAIIQQRLLGAGGLPAESWLPVCVTLSARTSAAALQEQVRARTLQRAPPPPWPRARRADAALPASRARPRLTAAWTSARRASLGRRSASAACSLW